MMINLRDTPVALHFTRQLPTQSNDPAVLPIRSRYLIFNVGLGHTDFVLRCNVQSYKGSARVKVEYGNAVLGSFDWYSGLVYIVGFVDTVDTGAYPGPYLKVTVEAVLDVAEYLLTVDLWLLCEEGSPAPYPYHVARPSGTVVPEEGGFTLPSTTVSTSTTTTEPTTTEVPTTGPDGFTTTTSTVTTTTVAPTVTVSTTAPLPTLTTAPSWLTTQAPVTTWTRTTANPNVTTTTTTPSVITTTTTTTTTSPVPTTVTTSTYPVTPSIQPVTTPVTTTQAPPATHPVDPTTEPLTMSVVQNGSLTNNTALYLNRVVATVVIRGGYGSYAVGYSDLPPPLVAHSYPDSVQALADITRINDLVGSEVLGEQGKFDDMSLGLDSCRVITVGDKAATARVPDDSKNAFFASNQQGDITFTVNVVDDAGAPQVSLPVHLTVNADDGFYSHSTHTLDDGYNQEGDLIIAGCDITAAFQSYSVSGADHFFEDQPATTGVVLNTFPSAKWYMGSQNIQYNAMVMKVNSALEPKSLKNWYFSFTPATVLKDPGSFFPCPLFNTDPVFLDTTASKWFTLANCLIIPRFKMIGKYTYWLFVFPEFTAFKNTQYANYLSNPTGIVWTKLSKLYHFYRGGPFVFSDYTQITDPSLAVPLTSPIFYAGTFLAQIKNDDNTQVLRSTGAIDFWYTCGDTTARPNANRRNYGVVSLE